MNDFDDELTGIFDNLSPSDFAPNQGEAPFGDWVRANIRSVRLGYLAAEGDVNPVAVLADASQEWTFTPEDDETLGDYVQRLREESHRLGATWLFLTRKTLVGNYDATDGAGPDIGDPTAVQKAIDQGLMSEGVYYYAERREAGEVDIRHGLMKAKGAELGKLVEGDGSNQTAQLFNNILG